MNAEELFKIAEDTFKSCLDTMNKKNHDDSRGEDALRNFKMVEYVNLTDIQTGVMVRLCDKFTRLSNLLHAEAAVKEESVNDTIDDSINYLVLLKACRKEKLNEEETKNTVIDSEIS